MSVTQSRPDLAAMLGFLHQARAEGELVLEQNDGTRRFFLKDGELSYLRSDAVGEQFGNYLIRLGVLDYNALKDLLAEDGARVGDRVVQWGLLTEEQRDTRLRELFGNILLHAVEHPVLNMVWNPGALGGSLGRDLQFHLDHRRVVWDVYRQVQTLDLLVEKFESEPDWEWRSQDGLLEALADLTLTPQLAFAISQLGREPMSFPTFVSVTGLDEREAARLLAALWALGGLELEARALGAFPGVQGKAPAPEKAPEPQAATPEIKAPSASPLPPPPPKAEPRAPAHEEPMLEAEEEALPLLNRFVPSLEKPARLPVLEEGRADSPQLKARVLFRQAEGLDTQGRTSEAIRALEQAIKLDPDSPKSFDAWMLLGNLRQGNPAWSTRAIEAYQAAARAQPKKGEPWLCMGQLYHRKGFGTNATGCFRKAMELDPSLELPDHAMGVENASEAPREGVMDRLRGFFGGEKK
ncbi:MAG TPA: tetratricopeptide repeat protein [Holophagaceae bacterium]|nr:tetratricopeptide repeat protein [Holophagaceae bacterium]